MTVAYTAVTPAGTVNVPLAKNNCWKFPTGRLTAPVALLTLVTPPFAAVVALVALVAFVAVAALPEMLMPQVPEASPPVRVGTLRFALAAESVDAPVPPLATGTAFTRPSLASS
jgi:hypothetical protein